MCATLHRYEGIDKARSDKITSKVNQHLLPSFSQLPGFSCVLAGSVIERAHLLCSGFRPRDRA